MYQRMQHILLSACLYPIRRKTATFHGLNLNVTPPNMPSTSFNRNSPSLLIDPQILEDTLIDIVDIVDIDISDFSKKS
ncbi:hypothetical protein SFRURICE_010407 [Spodoptera frugiperda]|nr:hypothetical protein SFRURICE_010407 [Spodoptera frugiperda]